MLFRRQDTSELLRVKTKKSQHEIADAPLIYRFAELSTANPEFGFGVMVMLSAVLRQTGEDARFTMAVRHENIAIGGAVPRSAQRTSNSERRTRTSKPGHPANCERWRFRIVSQHSAL